MNDSTNPSNQEIDLLKVTNNLSKKLSSSFNYFISFIQFIKRNILYILAVFILGAVLGFLYDKNFKKYYSNIIVSPNFETVDYLYDKVELANSNINQEAKEFLPSIDVNLESKISQIEIESVSDIYKFIQQEETYMDVFKIMSENNDANKVINDYATNKYFPLHKITIKSANKVSESDLINIMKFINDSDYYNKNRVEIVKNIKDKIEKNNLSIEQINKILNSVGSEAKSSSAVFYSDNTQLNDLVKNKTLLIQENHELSVHVKNLDYNITPINYSPNIIDKSGINGKMKFILPFVFVFGFLAFAFLRKVNK